MSATSRISWSRNLPEMGSTHRVAAKRLGEIEAEIEMLQAAIDSLRREEDAVIARHDAEVARDWSPEEIRAAKARG